MTQFIRVRLAEEPKSRGNERLINVDTIRMLGPTEADNGKVVIWFRLPEYRDVRALVVENTLDDIQAQVMR